MKRYGLWKYILILIVLSFGIIYSLPNLYAPDPAVQVSYNNSSQPADLNLQERIESIIDSGEDSIIDRLDLIPEEFDVEDQNNDVSVPVE